MVAPAAYPQPTSLIPIPQVQSFEVARDPRIQAVTTDELIAALKQLSAPGADGSLMQRILATINTPVTENLYTPELEGSIMNQALREADLKGRQLVADATVGANRNFVASDIGQTAITQAQGESARLQEDVRLALLIERANRIREEKLQQQQLAAGALSTQQGQLLDILGKERGLATTVDTTNAQLKEASATRAQNLGVEEARLKQEQEIAAIQQALYQESLDQEARLAKRQGYADLAGSLLGFAGGGGGAGILGKVGGLAMAHPVIAGTIGGLGILAGRAKAGKKGIITGKKGRLF